MNLYLIIANAEVPDGTHDTRAEWVGSQADAASARKKFNSGGFSRTQIFTHEVNVPTDKTGLLAFLNLAVSGPITVAASEKLTTK